MLPTIELYKAITIAERQKLFDDLTQIYAEIPQTNCNNCASCCHWGSPPAFFIEYLNMYKYVRDYKQEHWKTFLTKSAEYFYLELVDPDQTCPFISSDNQCMIYDVRPLTCRFYGLLNKEEFEMGNQADGLKLVAEKLWEAYQVKLPDEIANGTLSWCGNVRNSTGKYVKKETLGLIASKAANLDKRFFPEYLVDNEGTLLPYPLHLMNTALGDGTRARKVKIMKEFVDNGTKEELTPIVERASRYEF